MLESMIPETFASVLAAYATCFQALSYPTFQWLVLGWVQCHERRTLTAVALASGAVGSRHISVCRGSGKVILVAKSARRQWEVSAERQRASNASSRGESRPATRPRARS